MTTIRRVLSYPALLRPTSDTLLLAVDFLGTLVFAIEGGIAAARGHLDLLGALVLAFVGARRRNHPRCAHWGHSAQLYP